jgi:hypothetical protein
MESIQNLSKYEIPSDIQPALLTRSEIAYLTGKVTLTNIQKSKLNYKIRKRLEVFAKLELPLLENAGFSLFPTMKNCHSSDPGSNPGPGAYNFLREIEQLCRNILYNLMRQLST